ncbi:hypothetical protein RF11_14104 [Thelohanellus kitauei]|uniref:Uncharacterized protein n=1 Tax=Thelohanellus kitauei TaxID=669202 RepID=A0A0C2M3T0_THEKT|nr:hypothetical protein RF11_14104 [Thelohanellus kitauei]
MQKVERVLVYLQGTDPRVNSSDKGKPLQLHQETEAIIHIENEVMSQLTLVESSQVVCHISIKAKFMYLLVKGKHGDASVFAGIIIKHSSYLFNKSFHLLPTAQTNDLFDMQNYEISL